MVAEWLRTRMLKDDANRDQLSESIARHFNDAGTHKSHGRRIDRVEARKEGVEVEELENSQDFQDAVLTAYHVLTITFEKTPTSKILASDSGRVWLKNWTRPT
jgi:hypothetical protein